MHFELKGRASFDFNFYFGQIWLESTKWGTFILHIQPILAGS